MRLNSCENLFLCISFADNRSFFVSERILSPIVSSCFLRSINLLYNGAILCL